MMLLALALSLTLGVAGAAQDAIVDVDGVWESPTQEPMEKAPTATAGLRAPVLG